MTTELPRPVRIGVVVFAVVAITVAAVARRTGAYHVERPGVSVVAARALHFVDQADGGVVARDARTGVLAGAWGPGEGGFVRGAMRALARGRRLDGADASTPVTLTRWSDGRLTLDDPVTAARVELTAFGPANRSAFEPLAPPPPTTR